MINSISRTKNFTSGGQRFSAIPGRYDPLAIAGCAICYGLDKWYECSVHLAIKSRGQILVAKVT